MRVRVRVSVSASPSSDEGSATRRPASKSKSPSPRSRSTEKKKDVVFDEEVAKRGRSPIKAPSASRSRSNEMRSRSKNRDDRRREKSSDRKRRRSSDPGLDYIDERKGERRRRGSEERSPKRVGRIEKTTEKVPREEKAKNGGKEVKEKRGEVKEVGSLECKFCLRDVPFIDLSRSGSCVKRHAYRHCLVDGRNYTEEQRDAVVLYCFPTLEGMRTREIKERSTRFGKEKKMELESLISLLQLKRATTAEEKKRSHVENVARLDSAMAKLQEMCASGALGRSTRDDIKPLNCAESLDDSDADSEPTMKKSKSDSEKKKKKDMVSSSGAGTAGGGLQQGKKENEKKGEVKELTINPKPELDRSTIRVDGWERGSPLGVHPHALGAITVRGLEETVLRAGEVRRFTIDATRMAKAVVSAILPIGQQQPFVVERQNEPRVYDCHFTPVETVGEEAGALGSKKLMLSVFYGREHVHGSPFHLSFLPASDPSALRLLTPPSVAASRDGVIGIDRSDAGKIGTLEVEVTGPDGRRRHHEVAPTGTENVDELRFRTDLPGEYFVQVRLVGDEGRVVVKQARLMAEARGVREDVEITEMHMCERGLLIGEDHRIRLMRRVDDENARISLLETSGRGIEYVVESIRKGNEFEDVITIRARESRPRRITVLYGGIRVKEFEVATSAIKWVIDY